VNDDVPLLLRSKNNQPQ